MNVASKNNGLFLQNYTKVSKVFQVETADTKICIIKNSNLPEWPKLERVDTG